MAKEDNTGVKKTFDFLELNQQFMSLSQIDFIKSLKKHFKRDKLLSDRQLNILYEIKKNLKIDN